MPEDLLTALEDDAPLVIAPGAVLLRAAARALADAFPELLADVVAHAPFRHLVTPGGLRMSVAMTNCGALGWISDRRGYRYVAEDPATGLPWPPMPEPWQAFAAQAALRAGFAGFTPDACLVNRYAPGTRLSLHQDRDERDFGAPIVSVSIGLPTTFLFGGPRRQDRCMRVPLAHGDAVVWGGPARLHHHGVAPIAAGRHAIAGEFRYNLTFRRAG